MIECQGGGQYSIDTAGATVTMVMMIGEMMMVTLEGIYYEGVSRRVNEQC